MEAKDVSLTEQGELIWIERLRVASFVLTACLSEPLRALHLNETLVGRDVFRRRRNKKAPVHTHTHHYPHTVQMQVSGLVRYIFSNDAADSNAFCTLPPRNLPQPQTGPPGQHSLPRCHQSHLHIGRPKAELQPAPLTSAAPAKQHLIGGWVVLGRCKSLMQERMKNENHRLISFA